MASDIFHSVGFGIHANRWLRILCADSTPNDAEYMVHFLYQKGGAADAKIYNQQSKDGWILQ